MLSSGNIYKSKFGCHPCDKETFLKLKEINKAYIEALRMKAAWDRWYRKAPQNRVMRKKLRNSQGQVVFYMAPVPLPEPPINPIFHEKISFEGQRDVNGVFHKKPILQWKVNMLLEKIPELYREARYPQPTFCSLFEEGIIKMINELYDKVVEHRKVA